MYIVKVIKITYLGGNDLNSNLIKKVTVSVAATALLFSIVSPYSASANATSVSSATYNNSPAPVVPPLGGQGHVGGNAEQGKVGWTIKGIKAALKAGKTKIDNAISKAVGYLPVSQSMKNKIIAVVKVEALIKALDVVTDFSGSIEDALSQAIVHLGIPGWIADIIARAISAVLL